MTVGVAVLAVVSQTLRTTSITGRGLSTPSSSLNSSCRSIFNPALLAYGLRVATQRVEPELTRR